MSALGIHNKNQRRVSSFISYAFSSIIFDVIAYSMSGKFYAFIEGNKTLLFLFPSILLSWTNTYLKLYGYTPYASNVISLLIIGLPVVTFLAGLFVHKITERKQKDKRNNSEYLESSYQ